MWQRLKRFIGKIQNSDEAIKKRWLIGASAASMIIVIAAWLFYISFVIKPIGSPESPSADGQFWPIFKNGLVIVGAELKNLSGRVWDITKNQIKNLISIIMTERTITFEQR